MKVCREIRVQQFELYWLQKVFSSWAVGKPTLVSRSFDITPGRFDLLISLLVIVSFSRSALPF